MSEAVSGTGKAPGSIQVIERMMSLLDALAASPDAASLKQLALATELHPSTAHRILAAMSAARFVERQDAGTYRLGIRLLELGSIVKSRISLREYVLRLCDNLSDIYVKEAGKVELAVEADEVFLPLERTAPLGLILCELITNSLRHAFPDDQSGAIAVSLRQIGPNAAELRVSLKAAMYLVVGTCGPRHRSPHTRSPVCACRLS